MRAIAIFAVMMVVAVTPLCADEVQDAVNRQMQAARESLVKLRYRASNDEGMSRAVETLAVCINAKEGIFLTMGVPSGVPLQHLSDWKIVPANTVAEELDATLQGIDLSTGLSFIKCTAAAGKFTAVKFATAAESKLKPGDHVFSVVLAPGAKQYSPIVEVARVAGWSQAPTLRIMVTNGLFMGGSAPVYDKAGRAIGLVGSTREGPARLFVPYDEFAHVIATPPTDGKCRRGPWMGVSRMTALAKVALAKAEVKYPAGIRIDKTVPNAAADMAGLLAKDIIVKVDGGPLLVFPTPSMTLGSVLSYVGKRKMGNVVKFTVVRGGKEVTVDLKLGPMLKPVIEADRFFIRGIWIAGHQLTPAEGYQLNARAGEGGVIIDYIRPNSYASKQFARGDWILAINAVPVNGAKDVMPILKKQVADSMVRSIAFRVRRQTRAGLRETTVTFPKSDARPGPATP